MTPCCRLLAACCLVAVVCCCCCSLVTPAGHARGCAILDEKLVTTDEKTIEVAGLVSIVRTGKETSTFLSKTYPDEYLATEMGSCARAFAMAREACLVTTTP